MVLAEFPIAGAVAAKAIVSGKVADEKLLKPPAAGDPGVGRGLAEAVCNDNGQTGLLDFQYFAFNLVALLYFFVSFATTSAVNPSHGLPTIPATLVALSGVSTTAYVVKKQMESGLAPIIRSVSPMRVVLGTDTEIGITGDGFLAKGRLANSMFNQVLLDGRPLPTKDWRPTSVTAMLPKGLDGKALRDLGWKDGSPSA